MPGTGRGTVTVTVTRALTRRPGRLLSGSALVPVPLPGIFPLAGAAVGATGNDRPAPPQD
jgi:hypothetical protein